MPDTDSTRVGVGRRADDARSCREHEGRLDTMDQHIANNNGWLKGTASLVAVVGFVLTLFCTTIVTRLTSISDLLTDYKVMLKKHDVEIDNLKTDVQQIQQRHQFVDQSQVTIRKGK